MTEKLYRRWLSGIFAFVVVVALSALLLIPIARKARNEDNRTASESDSPQVTLRLNWTPDPTFAGAYMALATQTWEDAGLNVEIKEGGINLDPMRLVADGTDDFGIVGADRLLQACAENRNLVAVSLELRDNPVGWVVRQDSDIRTFNDLKGRRVGQKFGTETEAIWNAVVNLLGLDSSEITLVPVQFSLEPFVSGAVDAFPVYVNEEPNTLEARGVEVAVLHPADVGVSLYGNVLVTTHQTVQQRPEVVQRFVDGLLRGWKEASGDPTEVARGLVSVEPDMGSVPTKEVLIATLNLARGRGGEEHRFGWMELDRWERGHRVLARFAGLRSEMNVESCFTNRFVEQHYASSAPEG